MRWKLNISVEVSKNAEAPNSAQQIDTVLNVRNQKYMIKCHKIIDNVKQSKYRILVHIYT